MNLRPDRQSGIPDGGREPGPVGPRHRRGAPHGFTLVELLVVVAIVVMLVAILQPSLHQAMGYAKIAACASEMRQVGVASVAYGADHHLVEVFWRFEDWTGDYPYEFAHTKEPGNPARALHMANGQPQGYLPDGKIFFCPTYTLTHKNNYAPEPDPLARIPQFWGTSTWLFRPLKPADDPRWSLYSASNLIAHDNPGQASNVVMADTPLKAYGRVPNFKWGPQFEHYNALFSDGHVTMVSRDVKEMGEFLWGSYGSPN